MATALAAGTWAALWPTLGVKAGDFPARQQTPPKTPKAGPLGAASNVACIAPGVRVHDVAVPDLPAVAAAVVTGAGPGAGPLRAPGGWVLGTR